MLSMALVGCGADQPGWQTDRGSGTGGVTTRGSAPVAPRQIGFFSYENNGTVPPQHAIAVSIRMSSDGHGVTHVTRAYSQTDSLVFAVDTARVRQLYDSIRVRLVPAEKDDSGPARRETEPVGGPVHSFSVTVEGVESPAARRRG